MKAMLKFLICAVAVVSLTAPVSLFANSLRPFVPAGGEGASDTHVDRSVPGNMEEAQSPAQGEESGEEGEDTSPDVPAGTTDAAAEDDEQVPSEESRVDTPKEEASGEEQDAREKNETSAPVDTVQSLTAVGARRAEVEGRRLVIPAKPETMDFLGGNWSFDRSFVNSKGDSAGMDFSFDRDGQGVATLTDSDGRYTAKVRGTASDGILQLETTPFVDDGGNTVYPAEFMECRNSRDGAVCGGTDGFSFWDGMQPVGDASPSPVPAASSKHPGTADPAVPGTSPEKASEAAPETGSGAAFTELSSDGAELPPAVMDEAEKAALQPGSSPLAALAGDWRYSRDLARKTDGRSVALKFHFDGNGQGYSEIDDGTDSPWRAEAEAHAMPDGAIRIRTGAYGREGRQGYYPTFMECRSKDSPELSCAVSNGWTRIDEGRLVSTASMGSPDSGESSMEELLPLAPQPDATPGDSGTDGQATRSNTASDTDIAGMLAAMSSSAQEDPGSALPKTEQGSASSQQERIPRGEPLSLPDTDDGTLSFLEGHWRCNTGLARVSDNEPVVVEFRFGKNGKGTASVRERSGTVYTAAAQASYRDGTLRVNTSDYFAKGHKDCYTKSFITCVERKNHALCSGENGNVTWHGATFIRLQ